MLIEPSEISLTFDLVGERDGLVDVSPTLRGGRAVVVEGNLVVGSEWMTMDEGPVLLRIGCAGLGSLRGNWHVAESATHHSRLRLDEALLLHNAAGLTHNRLDAARDLDTSDS